MIKRISLILTVAFLLGSKSECLSQSYSDISTVKGIVHKSEGFYGGGISFSDFDENGWDDITIGTGAGDSIIFYANFNGNFTRVYPQGIKHTGEAKQLLWVDYDNDGDKDLYVATRNDINRLYENSGSFTFIDVTLAVGLPSYNDETFSAAFGDINNDGWLDLYVTNYNQAVFTNYLYLNNGKGDFIDITAASGTSDSIRYSFAAVFFDVNNDGYQDLYVGNDKISRNSLYLNNGDNTFTDISVSSNTDLYMDAMGVTVADFNNDLYADIYVSNTVIGNYLMQNDSNQVFSDVSSILNAQVKAQCWGVNFLDFDNDADQDLYVCNADIGVFNSLLVNNTSTFAHSMGAVFRGDTMDSYGNAVGDIDNDGFPDIIVGNNLHNNFIFRNSGNSNNWIKVALEGTVSNKDGIGSKIEVFTSSNHAVVYTHCGTGFQAQNSDQYIVGLNQESVVDSLIITWLSGHKDAFYGLSANQKYDIKEGGQLKVQAKLVADTNKICSGDSIDIRVEIPFKKYKWSNGDSLDKITIKNPGIYYANVENKFGIKISTDTIEIDTFLNSLLISTTAFPASSEVASDGYAVVDISGGYGNKFVIWNDPNYQITDTAMNLKPGEYRVVVRDEKGCFRIDKSEIGFLVGIEKANKIERLIVYPNPAKNELKIELPKNLSENFTLALYDMKGVEITNLVLSSNTISDNYSLDTQQLLSGNYFVSITSGKMLYTARFNVER